MNRAPSLVLAATALSIGLAPTDAATQATPPLNGFLEYARDAAAAWEATGLAVAVVKDGELIFSKLGTGRFPEHQEVIEKLT